MDRILGLRFSFPRRFSGILRRWTGFRILPGKKVIRYTVPSAARVAYLCRKLFVATSGSRCRSLEVKCSVRCSRLPDEEGSPAATLDKALSTPPAYVEMFHLWP